MLPSNISPESLPDKFNEFFVHKIDEIRRSFDPDRPVPTNPVELSGTTFAEFQLVKLCFSMLSQLETRHLTYVTI